MHFVIDGTLAKHGGQTTYLTNILPALASVDCANEYTVLLSERRGRFQRWGLPPNFRVEHIGFPSDAPYWRVLWEQTALPLRLLRSRADVLFTIGELAPVLAPCPTVVTFRNLLPYANSLRAEKRSRPLRWRLLRPLARLSSQRAARVLFVSHSAADAIAPTLDIAGDKKTVIHHGVSDTFFHRSADDQALCASVGLGNRPFILFVSVLYPHKNVETLLRAFALWRDRSRDNRDVCLAIVGPKVNRRYQALLDNETSHLGLDSHVLFLGRVNHPELAAIYRRALAFVFPSLAETFGLPVVEALASGTPVIASDIPSLREICGDGVRFFPPRDIEALAAHLDWARHLSLEDRAQVRDRGQQRASRFSWHNTAQATLDLLEDTANGN